MNTKKITVRTLLIVAIFALSLSGIGIRHTDAYVGQIGCGAPYLSGSWVVGSCYFQDYSGVGHYYQATLYRDYTLVASTVSRYAAGANIAVSVQTGTLSYSPPWKACIWVSQYGTVCGAQSYLARHEL